MGILTSEEPSQGLLFLGLQANRTSEITEVRDGRNFRASLESAHTHLAGGKVKVFCTPFTEQVTRLLYTTCTPCSPADDTQHLSLTEWSGGGGGLPDPATSATCQAPKAGQLGRKCEAPGRGPWSRKHSQKKVGRREAVPRDAGQVL